MYAAVPRAAPVAVATVPSNARAMPKSANRGRSPSMSTFDGLTSRWTNPFSCTFGLAQVLGRVLGDVGRPRLDEHGDGVAADLDGGDGASLPLADDQRAVRRPWGDDRLLDAPVSERPQERPVQCRSRAASAAGWSSVSVASSEIAVVVSVMLTGSPCAECYRLGGPVLPLVRGALEEGGARSASTGSRAASRGVDRHG
jgi:hypothetical protein